MRAAKRTTACVLAVFMAFAMLPLPASAATEHSVGNQTAFRTALDTAASGDTIKLTNSFDVSILQTIDIITITGKTLYFNLNGFTININSVLNALDVGSGGKVILEGEGAFNVTSTGSSSFGVYAHDGGEATVTNAQAPYIGAFAERGGKITVKGNAQGFWGVNATGPDSEVTVKGNATSAAGGIGARGDNGGSVVVERDVAGAYQGVLANGGSTVKVYGNVTCTQNNGIGVSVFGLNGMAYVGGNVTATGENSCGVSTTDTAVAIIDGVVTAPIYVRLVNRPVTIEKGKGAYDSVGDLPAPLKEQLGLPAGTYLAYTFPDNAIYIKKTVDSVCRIDTALYTDLGDALDDVQDGETIELMTDLEYGPIETSGKAFTLDLAGNELRIDLLDVGNGLTVGSDGAVEVTDSQEGGEFVINAAYSHGVYVYGGGEATLANTAITAGESGVFAEGAGSRIELTGDVTESAYGARAENGGTVTVTGDVAGTNAGAYAADGKDGDGLVEVTGTASGISFGGVGALAEEGGTVAVTGTASGAAGGRAIGDGSLVEVTGTATGILGPGAFAQDGGKVAVVGVAGGIGGAIAFDEDSSVEITGDVTASLDSLPVGISPESPSFGALVADGGEVSISGNVTVTGEGAVGAMMMGGGTVTVGGDLTVSGTDAVGVDAQDGGTAVIEGKLIAPEDRYIKFTVGEVTDFLTAGESEPGEDLYVGYLAYTDGVNFVYLNPAALAVCKIDTTRYLTLSAALDAVKAGETKTITLLADIDYSAGIVLHGKTVTLDLDGHTLNVTNNAGHGVEVGPGGKLLLVEDGGEFNAESIGGNYRYGVYAHGGGEAEVSSAAASPDADSAAACAEGAGSLVRVTGDAVSGEGYVGDGAYAAAGGTVLVGGDVQGINGACAIGATEEGVGSRVEVTGDAIGGALFGAYAEGGGTVVVTGDATGSTGARTRGGGTVSVGGDAAGDDDYGAHASGGGAVTVSGSARGSIDGAYASGTDDEGLRSRVAVAVDAVGEARYGARAAEGGAVTVGGKAAGGMTGAYAEGAGDEGLRSSVTVTGDAEGGTAAGESGDPCCGAHAAGGGVVTVGGMAMGFDAGAYAEGTTDDGLRSCVAVTGDTMGILAGAHAFWGGSVEVNLVAGIETAVRAEGAGSTVYVASSAVIPKIDDPPESVCVTAVDGGTATVDGTLVNMAGGAYIKLGDAERTAGTGAKGTAPYASYLIYADAGNTVRVKVTADCMIGDTFYALEDALDAVKDGETIKLLRDVDYAVELPDRPGIIISGKAVTFDLNGCELDVTNSAGHGLEVGSGGAVNLIENGGALNVMSSFDGDGVYAHDGGRAKVTSAAASGLGYAAARAEGPDSFVWVAGDAVSTGSPAGFGAHVSGGGAVLVDGDAHGVVGTAATGGGSIEIKGDVIASGTGATIEMGGLIRIRGDISVSGGDSPFAAGAVVVGSDSVILIGGNLTVTGTNATGVMSVTGGVTVIQGEINAPEDAYITMTALSDPPVMTYLTAGDGVRGPLPAALLELSELEDDGYRVYTDGESWVYRRDSVAGAEILPGSHIFAAAIEGYGVQAAREFTITNIGTTTITGLSAALGGSDFEISTALSKGSLGVGESATVSVRPKTGLPAGSHTDTLTVTGSGGISLTADLSFTVSASDPGGSEPTYLYRTLTDPATGITVSGSGIHRAARLSVTSMELHAAGTCTACDAIRAAQAQGELILGCDISLTLPAAGTLTVSIPVGSQYNGQTLTILHCKGGVLETLTATVSGGLATFTVSSLSPFAVTGRVLSPKTGDAASPAGWATMLGLTALCAGYLIARRRRV